MLSDRTISTSAEGTSRNPPSTMSYSKCNKLGLTFKDVKKQMLTRPAVGSTTDEPYDHDPMVKMNDYTKNISQEVFNNGNDRRATASTVSKSVISKKSTTGSEYLTKYSVNYNTR